MIHVCGHGGVVVLKDGKVGDLKLVVKYWRKQEIQTTLYMIQGKIK